MKCACGKYPNDTTVKTTHPVFGELVEYHKQVMCCVPMTITRTDSSLTIDERERST